MKENYPKAYTEVTEILKYMPKKDVEKIPKEMREMFESKKDKEYNFIVSETDDFSKIKILDETEAIFVNIFRDYWATPEQRDKIIAKQIYDKKYIEMEKTKKYNQSDIFKKHSKEITESTAKDEVNLPKGYKTDLFSKFKRFFKRLIRLS